jgi:hypothetical protein
MKTAQNRLEKFVQTAEDMLKENKMSFNEYREILNVVSTIKEWSPLMAKQNKIAKKEVLVDDLRYTIKVLNEVSELKSNKIEELEAENKRLADELDDAIDEKEGDSRLMENICKWNEINLTDDQKRNLAMYLATIQ